MNEDKVLEVLGKINNRLTSIEVDLRHHIKRSDTNEISIEKNKKSIHVLIIGAAVLSGAGLKTALPFIMKLLV